MSKFRALSLALLILLAGVALPAHAAPAAGGDTPSVSEILHWLWTSVLDAVQGDSTEGGPDEFGPVGDPNG